MALRVHPLTASKACGLVDQVGPASDLWQGRVREENKNSFEHAFAKMLMGRAPMDDRNVALGHSYRSWHVGSIKV